MQAELCDCKLPKALRLIGKSGSLPKVKNLEQQMSDHFITGEPNDFCDDPHT
jgi:hypothetical protein